MHKTNIYISITGYLTHSSDKSRTVTVVTKQKVSASLDGKEVFLKLNLNLGGCGATAWGCDLSQEYVTINSAYTT